MNICKPCKKILISSDIYLIFIEYLLVAYVLLFFRCFVCIDVDECAEGLRTCDEQSFCRNTEGSSTCVGNYCVSAVVFMVRYMLSMSHLWNLILSHIMRTLSWSHRLFCLLTTNIMLAFRHPGFLWHRIMKSIFLKLSALKKQLLSTLLHLGSIISKFICHTALLSANSSNMAIVTFCTCYLTCSLVYILFVLLLLYLVTKTSLPGELLLLYCDISL